MGDPALPRGAGPPQAWTSVPAAHSAARRVLPPPITNFSNFPFRWGGPGRSALPARTKGTGRPARPAEATFLALGKQPTRPSTRHRGTGTQAASRLRPASQADQPAQPGGGPGTPAPSPGGEPLTRLGNVRRDRAGDARPQDDVQRPQAPRAAPGPMAAPCRSGIDRPERARRASAPSAPARFQQRCGQMRWRGPRGGGGGRGAGGPGGPRERSWRPARPAGARGVSSGPACE